MGQISDHVRFDESELSLYMSDEIKTYFKSGEELDKAIEKFIVDCRNFAKENPEADTYIIEYACFPS